ncbi:MAG: c-type cytochrome [Acidobacteria bacterium]|nr:c-type cytochrome [Acidobacteriota bacterium]
MLRWILFLALAPAALAQHGTAGLGNPYATPEDVAEGALLFRSRCAVCHGPLGSGGKGSDLTTGVFRRGSSDDAVFKTIAEGVAGTEMPGLDLDGRRVWQLVGYVRSLSAGRAAEQAHGDADAGQAIFFGRGGCTNCHRVGSQGGVTGPDLSAIGLRSSAAFLEAALLRPSEDVRPEDWFVEARLPGGETVLGRRLNEDSFSLQLLTAETGLRSLSKQDVAEYRVIKTSTMPSYSERLTDQEVRDLVAYLAKLGR